MCFLVAHVGLKIGIEKDCGQTAKTTVSSLEYACRSSEGCLVVHALVTDSSGALLLGSHSSDGRF